jgi:hypothetical protein
MIDGCYKSIGVQYYTQEKATPWCGRASPDLRALMAIITWRSRFEMLVLASSTLMFVVYFQISMSILVALAKVSLTFDRRKPGERNTRRSSCNCVHALIKKKGRNKSASQFSTV